MPRDAETAGSPQHWMMRARSDYALASAPKPEGALWEDLCFHAQQAAEKSIKAVHLHHHISFRYVHDIEELLMSLERSKVAIPDNVKESVKLTDYATRTRYPDDSEPALEPEYREALRLAKIVMAWADSLTKVA